MDGLATVPPVTEPITTLVDGTCFAISRNSGVMTGGTDGLYFRDLRLVSRWSLTIDEAVPEPISLQPEAPYATTFLATTSVAGSTLLLECRRRVGQGMREDITVHNLGLRDISCRLSLQVGTDFADLFSVKEGRPAPFGAMSWTQTDNGVSVTTQRQGRSRGLRVELLAAAPGDHRAVRTDQDAGLIALDLHLPAHARWQGVVLACPLVDGNQIRPAFWEQEPGDRETPDTRRRDWEATTPTISVDLPVVSAVFRRSLADIGSLRIIDNESPDPAGSDVVAAGSPWFMTLFGRDSLLTAWMTLLADQQLALSTLRALARRQGQQVDPANEEEPGKILHEIRSSDAFPLSPHHGVYYGTIDATPLWCMLFGELRRWGASPEDLAALRDPFDRAMTWIVEYGDRDHDGFVEYEQSTAHGLANQGWKDSHDSMTFADGRLAEPPIAPAEVQGYAYAAFRAAAELARADGATNRAQEWDRRAQTLQQRFHERFWLPDRGYYAMALDGAKRPVDALASNMGHCLWTGIVPEEFAGKVVEHLMSPQMFSGWGIRTLATSMRRYDPTSYHDGSVWPHDNALCLAGMARYGYWREAQAGAKSMLAAAIAFGGRLPELFCGFDRSRYPLPVPYPTACSPQAWAAAAPLQILRSLLGLHPDVPAGRVGFDPHPIDELLGLAVTGLPIGEQRSAVVDHDGRLTLTGHPHD